MKSYEFISHTADVRLKIKGDSLEELFLAALQGMGNLIKKNICSDESIQNSKEEVLKEKIEVVAPDLTSLLIDFLSEVLTASQVNKVVYCKVKFEKIDHNNIKAIIYGTMVENFDEDIKAVTYHEAEVKKNNEGLWETIIIFDI